MADGVFRKKNGFTAVGNSIARDKVLSLKAKGLFLLIQSYINIPDSTWKKSDFQRMAIEGNKAFESAWKELKENGYLKSHIRTNGKNGCQFSTEYEMPKTSITYRKPRRLSDEQREQARQRMKKINQQ